MAGCTDVECKKKLAGHHLTLYGEDGLGGLAHKFGRMIDKACLNKYIRKPSIVLSVFLLAFLISVGGTMIKVWAFTEAGEGDHEKVIQHQERIALMEQAIGNIQSDISAINTSQLHQQTTLGLALTEIKKDRQLAVEDIKEMIILMHKP
jgi:hypothetical protein